MTFLRHAFVLATTLLALGSAAGARGADGPKKPLRPGDPVISIPLEDIGFEMAQPRMLLGGAAMYSLNFVDNTHLLVTYNTHGLIPRNRDLTPQDNDRLVAAMLLELPSGKVLAKTTWHTRDREQYLWPLSHGLFMLRIRNKLTVLDPLGNLASGNAFREASFLEIPRRLAYVSLSPGGDLLVLETIPPPRQESDEAAVAQAAGQAPGGSGLMLNTLSDPLTEILFYRLSFVEEPGKPTHLEVQNAGRVTARSLVRIPATSEGFLTMKRESATTWLFDFQTHAGKRMELSPFDTACSPSPYFVSRSEFVAIGCYGSQTPLSEFNLRGEEPWVQMLSGAPVVPLIASAPDAGRFAFSHLLVSSVYDAQDLSPDQVTGQEIAVLQNHDGRTLLKLRILPAQRTGQNFDLSPDGLSLTVIRNGNLEVYQLPALSAKDQEQVKLAQKDAPEKTEARIGLTMSGPARGGAGAAKAVEIPEPPPPAVTPPEAPAAKDSSAEGSQAIEPDVPRKPPSLYGPDFPKPTKPQ